MPLDWDGGSHGRVAFVTALPRAVPDVLAVGAYLKNTVCLITGDTARVSTDHGDLGTVDAIGAFEETVAEILALPGVAPAVVAHDLHPDFHSSRFAEQTAERLGVPAVPVQHHHAHVAAVMAEHGIDGPVLGLALDGFGLGERRESWGGELLRVDADGFSRVGHLALLRQPGGDAAARQPWRMAAATLHALGRDGEIAGRFAGQGGAEMIAQMLNRDVNCPPTSSCGRLFDAACGLLGVKPVAAFEGEAPMALEAMATAPRVESGSWRISDGVLDLLPLLDRLVATEAEDGANLFHGTLAAAMTAWVADAAEATGLRRVVLSGGCFLNAVLRSLLSDGLEKAGLIPLRPQQLTPGDGAVSLGQAWAVGMAKGS